MKVFLVALLLWFAAATDIAGKWTVVAKSPDGNEMKLVMEIRNAEGKVSGNLVTAEGDIVPLADLKYEGDQLSFKVPTDEGSYETTFTVGEKEMKGTYKAPGGTDRFPVTATRI